MDTINNYDYSVEILNLGILLRLSHHYKVHVNLHIILYLKISDSVINIFIFPDFHLLILLPNLAIALIFKI